MSAKGRVLRMGELDGWKPARATYGVVGWPVGHSLLPAMHTAALEALGVEADYVAFDVAPEELGGALELLGRAGVRGGNLTVPHKVAGATVVGELSDEARMAGAVSTVVFGEGGRAVGHNTDARGFSRAIREEFRMPLSEMKVLVLGAGGTGRAIAFQAARERAERIVLANRTVARAEALARDIAPMYLDDKLEGQAARLRALPLEGVALAGEMEGVDLIVNATSLGMRPGDASPLPAHLLRPHHLVYDTIYGPPRTPLLEAALEAGARGAGGLSMLLHQGALSLEIWLGRPAPVDVMRRALRGAVA